MINGLFYELKWMYILDFGSWRRGALKMGIVEKAAHHKVKKNKILLKFSFKQKKKIKIFL